MLLALSVTAQDKVSPFVRRAVALDHVARSKAKGVQRHTSAITTFVRTTDVSVLREKGCKVYAEFGDIVIASIPLDRVSTLAAMPQIQRIEAQQSCAVTNDTTAVITHVNEVWSPTIGSLSGLKGSGVIVGVMDIGFDLTHPNYYSADGSEYRVKAIWDQLDGTDNGDAVVGVDTVYVGRQYIGSEAVLAKAHSIDALTETHGTHTSGTAAGSGFAGSLPTGWKGSMTPFSGMAPEADICLVANLTSDNVELIPEEQRYKYTTATDMLGFKYIFDYAESVGKPCVINFSEGSYDDLYQSGLYLEVLNRLVGPGRIICASAGNSGSINSYLHKPLGQERGGAFLKSTNGPEAIYSFSSTKPLNLTLSFYVDRNNPERWSYDATELSAYPDSLMADTLLIGDRQYVIMLQTYPSCYDETLYATDLYVLILNEGEQSVGVTDPVSLAIHDSDNDVEGFMYIGMFEANELEPELNSFQKTHNILFPSSSPDVISVGNVAYRTSVTNYAGYNIRRNYGSEGVKSPNSSIGPAVSGIMKPDVMAPGCNIVSARSSFWREHTPDTPASSTDVLRSEYKGRTYPWGIESGTSMSSPVVTGVVALWLQAYPNLTPSQIMDVIAHTSRHHDETMDYPNPYYGHGLIDAEAGLQYIRGMFTGIDEVNTSHHSLSSGIFSLNGLRLSPSSTSHGIFIIVEDGKVRKVVR